MPRYLVPYQFFGYSVVFMDRFEEVVDMFFAEKLYSKIIHVYCEWCWLPGMCPDTGSEGSLFASPWIGFFLEDIGRGCLRVVGRIFPYGFICIRSHILWLLLGDCIVWRNLLEGCWVSFSYNLYVPLTCWDRKIERQWSWTWRQGWRQYCREGAWWWEYRPWEFHNIQDNLLYLRRR